MIARFKNKNERPPMIRVCLSLACALLLAACAAAPEASATAERDCSSVDAPTGSHLVRHTDCPRAAVGR
jgi:hypothetical protein